MIVKISLDEEMSEWLMTVSSNECRSNAQQVLYWLKKIKVGHGENELELDVPCKNQYGICEYKKGTEESQKKINQSKEVQQVGIQEQSNLSTMLEFI